jgi:aspartate/methionine/tyrosine aminotransferase
MFSERTNWRLARNQFTRAIDEMRAQGARLLDLAASNPTRVGLEYDSDAILGALQSERALDYDPRAKGLLVARQAVAQYYATDHGIYGVDPERIVLTTSTSEGYSYVFRLLCNAGDEVLVPKPSYPLFEFLADLQDVKLVPYPLIYDHGWQMDFHSLERAVTGRTRGVVVVHPNNPTGSYVHAGEMGPLNQFCRAHGLALIVDEVFLDYEFGISGAKAPALGGEADRSAGSAAPPESCAPLTSVVPPAFAVELRSIGQPMAAVPTGLGAAPSFVSNHDVLTFTVSGLSKISGLPQMKVAWILTSGPATQVDTALARLDVIADTYLSLNAPIQWAVPVMLEQRKDIQRQLLLRVRANVAELDRQLAGQRACERLCIEGGWYAVLRVPVTRSDEELAIELVRQRSVVVHPGHFYDFDSDGYLVLSLITELDAFEEGCQRVLDYMSS